MTDPPLPDASDVDLDDDDRGRVAALWQHKAQAELEASTAFAEVHRSAVILGCQKSILRAACEGISDELRHAELCHQVACLYAQQELPEPRAETVADNARFASADERQAALLYIVLHCALNEGIAAGYLKAVMAGARTRLVREATRRLLSDEVRHARLGWQVLGGAPAADRKTLSQALPGLLSTVQKLWVPLPSVHRQCPPGHGTLAETECATIVSEAVSTMILPGMRESQVDVGL